MIKIETDEYSELKKNAKMAATIFLLVIGFFTLLGSVVVIQAGTTGVLLQFGQIQNTLQPGIHFVIPVISEVHVMNMQTQKYEVETEAASQDLQNVYTNITINYHISNNDLAPQDIYKGFRGDIESRLIAPLTHEIVKATTAKFSAPDLIQKRETVKANIEENLKERLLPYGIEVQEVSITNFDFSPEFNAAIEAKVVIEQQKQQAQLELEQKQIDVQKLVVEQNATAMAQIIQANATATSTILKAQGDATAILLKAQAQKQAIELVNSVISPEYVQYTYATQWDGALPYFMGSSQPNMFFNMPTNQSG